MTTIVTKKNWRPGQASGLESIFRLAINSHALARARPFLQIQRRDRGAAFATSQILTIRRARKQGLLSLCLTRSPGSHALPGPKTGPAIRPDRSSNFARPASHVRTPV
jgi:hypothetical protein